MYSLLLLNGGVGTRAAAGQPKQLVHLNGIPILVYSLIAADACAHISTIVLNYPDGWRDDIEKIVIDYSVQTPVTYTPAGSSRHESVARMLASVDTEHVIIHETARPMVTVADFDRIVAHPGENVSFMSPIPFTVAPVDPETSRVTGSLDRSRLRNVQLPQKFRRTTLVEAHAYAAREGLTFTEDATLCATTGADVRFLPGTDHNFKVTTPTDIKLAGFLLSRESADE